MTAADVTIRAPTPEDDEQIIDIYNRVNAEFPPMPVEEYRDWMTRWPDAQLVRYVAELDGRIVGSLDVQEARWIARPNTFDFHLEVDAPYRRQGIGSRLYDLFPDALPRLARVYVDVRSDLPEAIRFAERRGFQPSGRADRLSVLNVHQADLAGFEGVEARLRSEGIEIKTLEEIGLDDESFLRALKDLVDRTVRDIPSSEDPADEPFERFVEETLRGTGKSPRWFWIALDGTRPVGLLRLRLRGNRAAGNSYTCVDSDYRGLGIARALKLRSVRWARENDIDRLFTGNDAENTRMLAINVSLGYQMLPEMVVMVKDLG